MLLDKILKGIERGVPKPIVNWDMMMRTILPRIKYYTDRVSAAAIAPCAWTHLIRELIYKIPVRDLLNMPSETTMYSTLLTTVIPSMEQILAPAYNIKRRMNCFTDSINGVTIQEFIIPCKSETPLLDLPIGQPGSPNWKEVHPVRIIYNDSKELCADYLSGKFIYRCLPPNIIIVGIDCCKLAFQYVNYVKHHTGTLTASINSFIREYIYPPLSHDICQCWVQTIMLNVISDSQEFVASTDNTIIQTAMVEHAIADMCHYRDMIISSQWRTGDFIKTHWFYDDCLESYMRKMVHNVTLTQLVHNAYLRFMIDYPLTKIIMMLCRNSDKASDRILNRALGIDLKRYTIANIFNSCADPDLRQDLTSKLNELILISGRDDIGSP